jgi:hypothetical protein
MTRTRAGLLALAACIAIVVGGLRTSPILIPATTCTNQFIRSIAAATGVGTCASIASADISGSFTGITGVGTLSAGTTASGFTVAVASLPASVPLLNAASNTFTGNINLTNSTPTLFLQGTEGSALTASIYESAGLLKIDRSGLLNVVSINLSTGAVALPALASSSSAQTGTVCWTTGTGNLTVDTTTTCLLSSAVFKHDIRPLENSLATVMALKPVSYVYNEDQFIPGEQVGFVAEDVAAVDERLVSRFPDGRVRSVRYQQLTADLAGAIQALKADNDNLREEVAELRRAIGK